MGNIDLEIAGYRKSRYTYDMARSPCWREICRYLQKYMQIEAHILDVGAGYGDFLRHIVAAQKYGLEIDGDLIEFWPRDVRPLIQSALEPFPLDSSTLDLVFASNFFEHFLIKDCRKILNEVDRVLKPRGRLIILQPNIRLEPGRYYDDYTHRTPFTEISFGNFLESLGWRILVCDGRFLPFTIKTAMPKARWLIRFYLLLPFRPFAGQFLLVAEKAVNE